MHTWCLKGYQVSVFWMLNDPQKFICEGLGPQDGIKEVVKSLGNVTSVLGSWGTCPSRGMGDPMGL